jgi:hypothetical protein
MGQHLGDIDIAARKKFFKCQAFFRGIRMERESGPSNINLEFVLQFFNTPGNEIAPRSNIVREYFQYL